MPLFRFTPFFLLSIFAIKSSLFIFSTDAGIMINIVDAVLVKIRKMKIIGWLG